MTSFLFKKEDGCSPAPVYSRPRKSKRNASGIYLSLDLQFFGGRGASSGGRSVQSALNKLNKLDNSKLSDMIKSPIPKIGLKEADELTKQWSKIKQKDRKALPEKEVSISDVVTWQNLVNKKGVERIIKGENTEHQGKNASPIYAMFSNGKYVLMDGNHRVTANLLLGKKKIKLRVKQ